MNNIKPRLRLRLKRLLERVFHVRIYGERVHGRDDCADIGGCGMPLSMVIDVGANIGQSAAKFRAAFPEATIHCIEPVTQVFDELVANVRDDARIRTHKLALGSRPGRASIFLTHHATTHSLVQPAESVGSEEVTVVTLDAFARESRIEQVDLLKIDAEGFDLEVLHGAHDLLAGGAIKFVLVEVGFSPGDPRHVLFDDVRSFLTPFGFALFGIYDQQVEWSGPQFIRFANVCYGHQSVFAHPG